MKKTSSVNKTATKKQTPSELVEQTVNPDAEDKALAPFVGALFREILGADDRQTVIVCFGTTAISGDSLGPMVGSILREKYDIPAFVYGTEDCSINGKNMDEWIDFIRQVHEGAVFIAVDASLGTEQKVGQIVLRSDGVCPAAIKGKKQRFGDVGILGVVEIGRAHV